MLCVLKTAAALPFNSHLMAPCACRLPPTCVLFDGPTHGIVCFPKPLACCESSAAGHLMFLVGCAVVWLTPSAHPPPPPPITTPHTLCLPQDMQPHLATAQNQINLFATTCGYTANFTQWLANITTNSSYTACPAVDSGCVLGTYQTSSGNCNTCYGDGTAVGPNCDSTAVIGCTSGACFCAPAYNANA